MDLPSIGFAAIVVGVAFGAIFAALDAALVGLGPVRLEALKETGGPDAIVAARVLRDLDAIRARLLAGRAMCLAAATAVAWSTASVLGTTWISVVAVGAVALLYSVAAEISTTLAQQTPGRWPLVLVRWLRPVEILLIPLGLPLVFVGRRAEAWAPEPEEPTEATERIAALTVEKVIEEGEESGTIDEAQAELLRSVLEFKDTVAREVMVPRTRMVAFDITENMRDVLAKMVAEAHSRYPVYRDTVDRMEGVLFAKDVYRFLEGGSRLDTVKVGDLVRKPVLFVAESQKISSVLRSMQSKRFHIAVVVDEFGGTSGIVTLEDILEEIVGKIEDEHDEGELRVKQLSPSRYLADAGISVYDLEEVLGEKLARGEGDYDSLGGLLVEAAGRVPSVGERVTLGALDFVVRDSNEKRVLRVEIEKQPREAAE